MFLRFACKRSKFTSILILMFYDAFKIDLAIFQALSSNVCVWHLLCLVSFKMNFYFSNLLLIVGNGANYLANKPIFHFHVDHLNFPFCAFFLHFEHKSTKTSCTDLAWNCAIFLLNIYLPNSFLAPFATKFVLSKAFLACLPNFLSQFVHFFD